MNTTPSTSPAPRPLQLLASVRDELRERRQARADQRVLERELASYTTRSEVDDLLAAMCENDSADAERVRAILNRNLQARGNGQLAS
jgi:hypothetical protein